MNKKRDTENQRYFIIAVGFVILLIFLTISAAYAYFSVSTTYNQTIATIQASLECFNVTYSESNVVNLSNDYPVSDTYALSRTPLTVSITNNCGSGNSAIPYMLVMTSLSNGTSSYMPNSTIRTSVKRKIGTASETTFVSPSYITSLTTLTSGNVYTKLVADLNSRAETQSLTTRTNYQIDSSTIAYGQTITYKVYLWVDYYEGDTTHTGLNDNSTQNKLFKAAISLILNN